MQYFYDDNDDTIYKVKMSQAQFNASRLCYYLKSKRYLINKTDNKKNDYGYIVYIFNYDYFF